MAFSSSLSSRASIFFSSPPPCLVLSAMVSAKTLDRVWSVLRAIIEVRAMAE